jgi:hypothetical protein
MDKWVPTTIELYLLTEIAKRISRESVQKSFVICIIVHKRAVNYLIHIHESSVAGSGSGAFYPRIRTGKNLDPGYGMNFLQGADDKLGQTPRTHLKQ